MVGPYCASKWAVEGLTKSLALEIGTMRVVSCRMRRLLTAAPVLTFAAVLRLRVHTLASPRGALGPPTRPLRFVARRLAE
jgi:NAD(P)-dependent dehydrogenase (short-subunit alcohol dehydrogenase family)